MSKLSDYVLPFVLKRAGRAQSFGAEGVQGDDGEQGPQGLPGDDDLFVATVELSAAQILDLHNTPVEIAPAPGEGKRIWIVQAVGQYAMGETNFDNDTDITLIHHGMENEELSSLGWGLEHIFVPGEDAIRLFSHFEVDPIDQFKFENKALIVHMDDEVPSEGDGTLTITAWYVHADL